jgi:hypothetical protein
MDKFAFSPEAKILASSVIAIAGAYRLVDEINSKVATKYDPMNPAHERKLLEVTNSISCEA